MTQSDQSPAPQQPQPLQPVTEMSLWEDICKQASALLERPADKPLRFGQFALGQVFIFWKGEPLADGSVPARGVTIYERSKPAPLKASLGVMAIFGFADDFVRVYCLPIDPSDKSVLGPARITLSRTAPVPSVFLEYIPIEQYKAEIASEIVNDLGGIPGDDEDEEEDGEGDDEDGFTPT